MYGDHLGHHKDHPCWMEYVMTRDRPITIGVDLGYRRSAWVVIQETLRGDELVDVVCDEGIVADTSAVELAEIFREKYRKYRIEAIYTDYSNTSEPDRRIIKKVLRGVKVRPAIAPSSVKYYRIEQGVNLVRQRCRDIDGLRHLYISKHLYGNKGRGQDMVMIRDALGAYREPPDKRRFHVLDALRYAILGKHGPRGQVTIGGR